MRPVIVACFGHISSCLSYVISGKFIIQKDRHVLVSPEVS